MSNIKLTKQDIEHLKKMQVEINSRGDKFKIDTIYQICVDEFVPDHRLCDDYGDYIYVIDSEGYNNPEIYENSVSGCVEYIDNFMEDWKDEGVKDELEILVKYKTSLQDYIDFSVEELSCVINEFCNLVGISGYLFLTGKYEQKFQNAFLTEFECKRHIEANKHHYNNPVVFENYAFRNNDLSSVLRLLSNIDLDKLEISNE